MTDKSKINEVNADKIESKKIKGKIQALHGSKGAVRALFEKGMPGQAIGGKISIN
jgi:ribosomal protein L35AE/L33A